jgi:hypothetical protein
MMAALMKSVIDVARHDSPGRNARDGFATEQAVAILLRE